MRIENPFAEDGGLIKDWPKPCEYWFSSRHGWSGVTPNDLMANLANHEVVEHEDGTITVQPSIKVRSSSKSWHGYLERGIWREC